MLAAVQEGRGVGALMAAVVGVRLPALTLLLPATMQDPDEGLKIQNQLVQNQILITASVISLVVLVVFVPVVSVLVTAVVISVPVAVLCYLLELAAVAGVDDGVEAAVEVSEPENDFKAGLRRTEAAVERAWKQQIDK